MTNGVHAMVAFCQRRIRATRTTISVWLVAVTFMMLVIASPALAVLGGNAASVEGDRAYMRGSLRITGAERYAVHEIESATGTVVREYVAPNGTVFAVAWQ